MLTPPLHLTLTVVIFGFSFVKNSFRLSVSYRQPPIVNYSCGAAEAPGGAAPGRLNPSRPSCADTEPKRVKYHRACGQLRPHTPSSGRAPQIPGIPVSNGELRFNPVALHVSEASFSLRRSRRHLSRRSRASLPGPGSAGPARMVQF